MPDLPYPLMSDALEELKPQILDMFRDIYENRVGGATVGDVFQIGGEVLELKLKSGSGLTKTSGELDIDLTILGASGGITKSQYTAKGIILVGNGVSVIYALPVGADGSVLKASSTSDGGMQWANITASEVTNTPAGGISAATVQAAINELDTEKTTLTAVKADTDVASAISLKHSAVTIGTANGLSLSTQELSLAAATSGNAGAATATQISKLDGIEALADVTDATNVAAAGAVMEGDTTTASMSFVIDEDDMASNLDTKVPTQQSVKAYVDAHSGGSGSNFMEFTNLNFTASVGSKALTIALKGTDGNDPSASNIVVVPFRNATLTSGAITSVNVASAQSLVLPSGATLGFANSETGRAYLWEINNAGTAELAISRTADIFSESNLVSTTAIGTGSDSASVMYSTSARTNVACRCIGYIEIQTGATSGEWDNAPSKLQVMGPGVKRTGDILQIKKTLFQTHATGTTVLPADGTVPQITEGDEYFTQAITPTNAINKLQIYVVTLMAHNIAGEVGTTALFQDTTANALISSVYHSTQNQMHISVLQHLMVAGTTSETTFRVRCGAGSAGTCEVNGYGGLLRVGVSPTSITITEIFA